MGRRGSGEDAIYFDHAAECKDARYHKPCRGRWRGAVSLGYDGSGKRIRRKVSGQTKQAVLDALKDVHKEIDAGVKASGTYTVADCMRDWVASLEGNVSSKTVKNAKADAQHAIDKLGHMKLKDLTGADVQDMLATLAKNRSTRAVQLARAAMIRAIKYAEFRDLVSRNVADKTTTPKGRPWKKGKAFTVEQVIAVLAAAKDNPLYAYIAVCVTTGIRTEEARALTWDHVDLEGLPDAEPPVPPHIELVTADRHGGDTKTPLSRRGMELRPWVVQALKEHKAAQDHHKQKREEQGKPYLDDRIVFASESGTQLDAANIRRSYRAITEAAGLREGWVPRWLRHTYVSLESDSGRPLREIADAVGHATTKTTELVYRDQLQPVIRASAGTMASLAAGTGRP